MQAKTILHSSFRVSVLSYHSTGAAANAWHVQRQIVNILPLFWRNLLCLAKPEPPFATQPG